MAAAPHLAHTVAVIGGGPAGLMAAEVLTESGVTVRLFERMPTLGRKLLMAGRGGLNLTHSEPLDDFIARYGPAGGRLQPLIEAFPPQALREWAADLGQATFVGSSGRVFPEALKASPLLRAWIARLERLGVDIRLRHDWRGWDGQGALRFAAGAGEISVQADAVVLALGGASWPRLGSDGGWRRLLQDRGVVVEAFRPANSGFDVGWSPIFRQRFAGQPLKGVALSFGDRSVRGEAMITAYGLEGGAVYALSAPLREAIASAGEAMLIVDLSPDLSTGQLAERLGRAGRGQSLANVLRKACRLSPVAANLLREAHGTALPHEPLALAGAIKQAPLKLTGVQPLARAISSAGGVSWEEVGTDLQLHRLPGVFVAGEMLDWEAPTGGYLLQACFASGVAAARGVLARLQP